MAKHKLIIKLEFDMEEVGNGQIMVSYEEPELSQNLIFDEIRKLVGEIEMLDVGEWHGGFRQIIFEKIIKKDLEH